MADADFTVNETQYAVPVFKVKLHEGQIVDLKLPEGIKLNDNTYALNFEGSDWTGQFSDGDLLFLDPNQTPVGLDYVAIYPKGESVPAIEQMAMSFMPGSIGEIPHPESNVIPVLSIRRPNGVVRTVECSKLVRVEKIVGVASSMGDKNEYAN